MTRANPQYTPAGRPPGTRSLAEPGRDCHATPAVASSSLIASTAVGIFTLPGWIVLLSHLQ
jgi:predicted permease